MHIEASAICKNYNIKYYGTCFYNAPVGNIICTQWGNVIFDMRNFNQSSENNEITPL
jgi:hypothetical protein